MRRKNHNSKLKIKIATIICAILSVYFTYHTIIGDRGLIALYKLNKLSNELKIKADHYIVEKINLETQIAYLKPDTLDVDLLDEKARRLLGYANKDEIIYSINNQ